MPNKLKTILFTLLALVAFAANSVLCRLALGEAAIGAMEFSLVRLLSAIVALVPIYFYVLSKQGVSAKEASVTLLSTDTWRLKSCLSSLYLMIYAVGFSYAYTDLDTATGALILFAVVQMTMIIATVFRTKALSAWELLGSLLAFSGFLYLILPGISRPSVAGFLCMGLAGIAWAFYTLAGKDSEQPVLDTALNFMRLLPMLLLITLLVFILSEINATGKGLTYAMLSGVFASGLGYAVWYMALPNLKTMQAAVLQLSVPIFAALGGIVFVAEPISMRFVIATVLVLSGIFLVVFSKRKVN